MTLLRVNFFAVFIVVLANACITTESRDFVNYKAIGDVYTTKPQAVDYEEVGNVGGGSSGFFWDKCANICREAIQQVKYSSKNHGGDSIVELRYANEDGNRTKNPTCVTTWGWALWTYGLGAVAPWIKTCDVEGIAVSRVEQKKRMKQAQEKQSQGRGINININNTQNNTGRTKKAH